MLQKSSSHKRVVILGAGCSGLSVAWGLCAHKNFEVTLLEAADKVGGLSQTIEKEGLHFDIGPHRLSPQLPGIVEKIRELPDIDLMELENEHGVYFSGTVYSYPPTLKDLCNFESVKQTLVFGGGWLYARTTSFIKTLFSVKDTDTTFEDIILRSFGRPFSNKVAFPMIRKVWGTQDLHEDFARVRFELPTIRTMMKRLLMGRSIAGARLFYYPRKGFGKIPEAISRHIQSCGHIIELSAEINQIEAATINGPFRIIYEQDGKEHTLWADLIISTISNQDLIRYLTPALIEPLLTLAKAFPSRTMRLGIIVVKNYKLPARVIIFPEERIIFNRLSSFDQFSSEICPEGHAVLMCDVICDQGSRIDIMSDAEFNEIVLASMLELRWFSRKDIAQCFSLRFPGAYPVLHHERFRSQDQIEAFFYGSGITLCGREASSDYNNAHNAIGKGLLTAKYISGEIDAAVLQSGARSVGRLPIQD